MSYKPTDVEGQALHQLAIALRPDWIRNKPGTTWYAKTSNGVFVHAENFEHCIQALIAYATEQRDGKPVKRTPDIYPDEGDHWETTRPIEHQRPGKQRPCQDHTAYSERTCPVCADEIAARQRSPQQRGKRIRKITPSPGILTGHAQDTAQ